MIAHDIHQRERAADVVGVVLDGLLYALAHGLEAREVDHAVDVERVEDGVEGVAVVDVGAHEGETLGGLVPHDGVDAVQHLLARVGQVVHDDDLVALLQQAYHRVAADEPAAAGDEHAGVLGCLLLAHAFLPRVVCNNP